MQLILNRGEKVAIPFIINDTGNSLLAMRVTWSVAASPASGRILRKIGGLPGSTADVSITTQTAVQITGTININATDFDVLPKESYYATLWVDDGLGNDRCVTTGGNDAVKINNAALRIA